MKYLFFVMIFCFSFSTYSQTGNKKDNSDGKSKDKKKENVKNDVNASSGATWDASSMMNRMKGSVYGKIQDSKGDNLQFATVTLYSSKDGEDKIIEGVLTDVKGYFKIEDVPMGNNYILVEYLGYKQSKNEFILSAKNKNFNIKNIILEPSSKEISAVNVTEKAPLYQNKMEKIIYNAEEDVNSASDDATDVLRKTPLLTVDFEGNVKLQGSGKITFLMNGRASSLVDQDALQMIPADQIKSIEVITSPTAEYDGEGVGGIVNIVTKQKIVTGFSGQVDGSVGTRANSAGVKLNLGLGRFSISGRGSAHFGWPREGSNYHYRTHFDNNGNVIDSLYAVGDTESNRGWYRGNINMNYELNDFNSFNSVFRYRGSSQLNNRYLQEYFLDYNNISSTYDLTQETDKLNTDFELTNDYIRRFRSHEDRELRVGFQLGYASHNDNQIIKEVYSPLDSTIIDNPRTPEIKSFIYQMDYTHPFSKKKKTKKNKSIDSNPGFGKGGGWYGGRGKDNTVASENSIKVGFKITDRDNSNDFAATEIKNGITSIIADGNYSYGQNIKAAYISTNWSLSDKFDMILGGRYENTNISFSEEDTSYSNSYGVFLPSFILSNKISLFQTLKLSYSKRISRPSQYYIHPETDYSNRNSISIGNPYLKPETSQKVELSFSNFLPGFITNFFVYYKHVDDRIQDYMFYDDINNISTTEYFNIGIDKEYGFNFFTSIGIIKWMDLRGGFNLGYKSIMIDSDDINHSFIDDFGDDDKISSFRYDYNAGITVKAPKGFKLEYWTFYRSPELTTQGTSTSFFMSSLGFKKDFADKRGSLGLRIMGPFQKDKSFVTDYSTSSMNYYSDYTILFRSIGLSFKYKFGKLDFKSKVDNTIIKNDDLLEDGGGEY